MAEVQEEIHRILENTSWTGTSHLPYPIGQNKSIWLSQDLKDGEIDCVSLVTGTGKSHENEGGYRAAELDSLTQFITFTRYRMLSKNIAYLFNSLFISHIPCFSWLCVNWSKEFPTARTCTSSFSFKQGETGGLQRWPHSSSPPGVCTLV